MTTKQKQNIARFKAVQAEAKKLKAKNKNLTHVQAVKQAWAILYSKEKKSPAKKKVGALPIGFTGKILGVPFKVVNQFDIYGEVNAIVENTDTGKKIIVIDGKASTKDLAEKFFTHIKLNVDYEKNEIPKDIFARIQKFVIGLNKEVKDYNAGKKQTIKKQPLIITAKKKSSSPKKSKVVKIKKSATKKTSSSGSKKKLTYVGVRKLESGESRYQYKLAGVGSVNKSILDNLNKVETEISYTEHSVQNLKTKLKDKNYFVNSNYTPAMIKKIIAKEMKYISELKKHKAELKKLL